MSKIPRKSDIKLTSNEIRMINEFNKERIGKYCDKEGMTEQEACDEILRNLYYAIGMSDYDIYKDASENSEKLAENTRKHLGERAIASARIKVLLEYMKKKNLDTKTLFKFGKKEKTNDKPVRVYHGTANEEVTANELGNLNEDGVYEIRDGVSYWTTSFENADKYRRRGADNINDVNKRRAEKDESAPKAKIYGQVFEKKLNLDDKCVLIPETSGGACFFWQDEFIQMNREGIRYLFPERSNDESTKNDVLDISHYEDFVKRRDESVIKTLEQCELSLPEESDSLLRLS